MKPEGHLLGWVEERSAVAFVGAFVGEDAVGRVPAVRACSSANEARQWVEQQAAALGLPVRWLSATPTEYDQASRPGWH
jgi:hypothetical protein